MSIPRKDPNFTEADFLLVAEEFLAAGMKFWEARHKFGLSGAVVWYKNTDIGTAIFTRGEYDYQLTAAIENQGQTVFFGSAKGEEE